MSAALIVDHSLQQAIEMADILEQGLGAASVSPKDLHERSFTLPEGKQLMSQILQRPTS